MNGTENFWTLQPSSRGSWIWKSLCKLRTEARPFIYCQNGSGITASFWLDNWTSLGPLIELVGERGPAVTGITLNAVVADALTSDGWCFERSRSRNSIITFLRDNLPDSSPIMAQKLMINMFGLLMGRMVQRHSPLVRRGEPYFPARWRCFGTRWCGSRGGFLSMISYYLGWQP